MKLLHTYCVPSGIRVYDSLTHLRSVRTGWRMTLSCHTCQNTVSFCRLSYSLHFKPCTSVPVDHLVRDLIDGIEGGFLLGQSQRQSAPSQIHSLRACHPVCYKCEEKYIQAVSGLSTRSIPGCLTSSYRFCASILTFPCAPFSIH